MAKVKKDAVKKAQNGTYFAFKNGRVGRTRPIYKDLADYESMDTTGYAKGKKKFDVTTSNPVRAKRTETISREQVPSKINDLKKGATRIEDYKTPKKSKAGNKLTKAKAGKEMIKRADGSVSQRGLWDNIRAAKGSGKKPTAQMLKQEKKIKAKSKK
jgi:hypothetical protein